MEGEQEKQQVLSAVLSQYRLNIRYLEDFGKITKVYTDQGIFALKGMRPNQGIDFIRNVQTLYQRGYNRIVPIYQSADGRYGVLHEKRLYYLMPWLDDIETGERSERHKQMFRELARMHTLSVRETTVDQEERELHYNQTMDEWRKQREFLDEFVVQCEKKWYMSPFEMMFCRYFTDISQAMDFSLKKMEEWEEKTREMEKVRMVVTHGRLSLKHFIYNDRGFGYFINFEKSRYAPPHFDLLPFIEKTAKTYPVSSDDCVDWLYNYFRHFPFKEEEMLLFQSYLAYPGATLAIMKDYLENRGSRSEYQSMKRLQRRFWQLKNIEYVVMKIEEAENAKKAAKAQAEQTQS